MVFLKYRHDDTKDPVSQRVTSESEQLTIFYAGIVHVYDNISVQKVSTNIRNCKNCALFFLIFVSFGNFPEIISQTTHFFLRNLSDFFELKFKIERVTF